MGSLWPAAGAAAFLRSAAALSTPWPAAAPAAFLRSAAALSTPWPAAVYCWAELFPFHAIPAAIAARKAATPTAGNDEAEAATAGPPKAAASTSTGAATPTAAHGRAETAAAATNATKEGRRAIPQHYP